MRRQGTRLTNDGSHAPRVDKFDSKRKKIKPSTSGIVPNWESRVSEQATWIKKASTGNPTKRPGQQPGSVALGGLDDERAPATFLSLSAHSRKDNVSHPFSPFGNVLINCTVRRCQQRE